MTLINNELPIPRVQVRKYKGKNGGFAVNESTLYACELVGVNGDTRLESENIVIGYAMRDSGIWHDFTGWPVIWAEEKRDYTTSLEKI